MAKVYLVEFTNKTTGAVFQKFGWCAAYDVLERFSVATSISYGRDPTQYDKFTIRVLASAYTRSIEQAKLAEAAMQQKYPKNLWINESFSGISEIVNLNPDQRTQAIQDIRQYSKQWREPLDT